MARKRKKGRVQPVPEPETLSLGEPTIERLQHDIIERVRSSRGSRVGDKGPHRVETQRWLDTCRKNDWIRRGEYDAGNQLYSEWRRSGAEQSIIGSLMLNIQGRHEMSDRAAELYMFVLEALSEVGKPLDSVLRDVCLFNDKAADWARKRGAPDSWGMVALRLGLQALEHHYRQRDKQR